MLGAVYVGSQPGGHVIARPPSTWTWAWKTLCCASAPVLNTPRYPAPRPSWAATAPTASNSSTTRCGDDSPNATMSGWCSLGITSTWVGACGSMSRNAIVVAVSWMMSAGISRATILQNRQSLGAAVLAAALAEVWSVLGCAVLMVRGYGAPGHCAWTHRSTAQWSRASYQRENVDRGRTRRGGACHRGVGGRYSSHRPVCRPLAFARPPLVAAGQGSVRGRGDGAGGLRGSARPLVQASRPRPGPGLPPSQCGQQPTLGASAPDRRGPLSERRDQSPHRLRHDHGAQRRDARPRACDRRPVGCRSGSTAATTARGSDPALLP